MGCRTASSAARRRSTCCSASGRARVVFQRGAGRRVRAPPGAGRRGASRRAGLERRRGYKLLLPAAGMPVPFGHRGGGARRRRPRGAARNRARALPGVAGTAASASWPAGCSASATWATSMPRWCWARWAVSRLLRAQGVPIGQGGVRARWRSWHAGDLVSLLGTGARVGLSDLVPRQHSSGGKPNLLSISKRGDVYLRTLLIHGARSAILAAQRRASTRTSGWPSCSIGVTRTLRPSRWPTRTRERSGRCLHTAESSDPTTRPRSGRVVESVDRKQTRQRRTHHRLLRRSRSDGKIGQTVVGEAQNARSTSSARKRLRSQPANPIRDSDHAATKVRMYGCNLPFEPS